MGTEGLDGIISLNVEFNYEYQNLIKITSLFTIAIQFVNWLKCNQI